MTSFEANRKETQTNKNIANPVSGISEVHIKQLKPHFFIALYFPAHDRANVFNLGTEVLLREPSAGKYEARSEFLSCFSVACKFFFFQNLVPNPNYLFTLLFTKF